MADLSQLSDSDFRALQSGDLRGMSDAGFALLLQATPGAIGPQGVAEVREQSARERATAERAEVDPTRGMSTPELIAAGAGRSVVETGRAIKQATGRMSRAEVDETRALDRPLMQTTGGRIGSVVGSAAQAVPLAMMPGAGTALGAALYGAAFNAAQPVETGEEGPGKRAMLGALTGGATVGGANALTWLLDPKPAAAAALLYGAGDKSLSPGQALGGSWKRAEDALTSLPFSGDLIKSAQRRGVEGFNVAVANRALKHIGAAVPQGVQPGRQLVQHVETTIGDAYDDVLSRVPAVQRDATFAAEIGQLRNAVKQSTLPKQVQSQFEAAIRNQIDGKFQGRSATMTAQTFKDAEGELGRLAAKYAGDASVDKQLLGDALQEAQAALRRLLERSAGPKVAADAKAANAAWAEFKRLQRAAGAQGSADGVFSAEQYRAAVRALDTSKDKSAFARGSALGEDFADAGVEMLGRTVPDSGTPFRTLMTQPVKGAVSAAITGLPVGALYNQPAMNALQLLALSKRPALATKAAAELQKLAPVIGAGAVVSQRR